MHTEHVQALEQPSQRLLKATYMSDKERNIVLDVTSDCLKRLAKVGGPISYFEVLNKNN